MLFCVVLNALGKLLPTARGLIPDACRVICDFARLQRTAHANCSPLCAAMAFKSFRSECQQMKEHGIARPSKDSHSGRARRVPAPAG